MYCYTVFTVAQFQPPICADIHVFKGVTLRCGHRGFGLRPSSRYAMLCYAMLCYAMLCFYCSATSRDAAAAVTATVVRTVVKGGNAYELEKLYERDMKNKIFTLGRTSAQMHRCCL